MSTQDPRVEPAAKALVENFSFFDPSDNADAWRAARLVLAAADAVEGDRPRRCQIHRFNDEGGCMVCGVTRAQLMYSPSPGGGVEPSREDRLSGDVDTLRSEVLVRRMQVEQLEARIVELTRERDEREGWAEAHLRSATTYRDKSDRLEARVVELTAALRDLLLETPVTADSWGTPTGSPAWLRHQALRDRVAALAAAGEGENQ